MFRKVLIANRGEIACRIARTLRRMGIAVATVHSEADARALHVREIGESVLLGPAPAVHSYLAIDKVVAAAGKVGADAVHPGFGFLSENAAFARACAEAGIAFVGPAPETLALFGDKAAAKRLAQALGIPTAGGSDEPTDDVEAMLAATAGLPLPFVLKACAGGGGKGMRVVRDRADARAAIEAAIREGRSAFGDGRLIAERYLQPARHVEVQILGDGHGGVIHLHDRECSLQRRYQKIVEEAPALGLPQREREALRRHAEAIGRRARYLGLGTVEFAVGPEGAVFLEVNPRLQVEHPVTEAVLGLDLVELQVSTVAERRLPLRQEDVPGPQGVAIQARLYAEDPDRGFLPSTGRLAVFDAPAGLRADSGVDAGSEVTPHYDPMIAKLIAHAPSRDAALDRLRAGLDRTRVLGVQTNRAFLADLLAAPQVRAHEVDTEFVDRWVAQRAVPTLSAREVAVLSAAWLHRQRAGAAPRAGAWSDPELAGWRLRRAGPPEVALAWRAVSADGEWRVGLGRDGRDALVRVDDAVFRVALDDGAGTAAVDGTTIALHAHAAGPSLLARLGGRDVALELRPLHDGRRGAVGAQQGVVRAPMMGLITGVDAAVGRAVAVGERLATLESMKMEMTIAAPVAGVVAWVGCAARAKVERHQDLFRIEAAT